MTAHAAVSEVVAGPIGTPFDTSAEMPGDSTLGPRSEEDEAFYLVTELLDGYFGSASQDTMTRLEKMAEEQRLKHVIRVVGLDVRDDLHWDIVSEQLPGYMSTKSRQLLKHGARGSVNEAVNNPDEMATDDLVVYLTNQPDYNDELMNDLHVVDAERDEAEVIYAGTSIHQALVQLGEEEPDSEPDDVYSDEEMDDPWHESGPYWEREYMSDEASLLDLIAEKNPKTGEYEMENLWGEGMISANEWMDQSNYDLYYDIPMNVRRPDGKPFDEVDVQRITNWFDGEVRGMRKYAPGIKVELHPQVGDTNIDTQWYFN